MRIGMHPVVLFRLLGFILFKYIVRTHQQTFTVCCWCCCGRIYLVSTFRLLCCADRVLLAVSAKKHPTRASSLRHARRATLKRGR